MISVKAKVPSLGQMEDNTLVSGKEASNMEEVLTLVKKA